MNEAGRNEQILPRIYTDSQGIRSLPAHLKSYGPLWEPPAYIHPVYDPSAAGWKVQRDPIQLSPIIRSRMIAAEAALFYGPAMELLCDLGWYKTKWNTAEKQENDRWGGWYDDLKSSASCIRDAMLNDEQSKEYIPVGVKFPAQAKDPVVPSSGNRIRKTVRNDLGNIWAIGDDSGSLDLYAGPLRKPGYILNAGAPVWSIDFLSGTDCFLNPRSTKPGSSPPSRSSTFDILALSTISQDPGLLPPVEILKRGTDAKSSVQIWSIPFNEPSNFGRADDDEELQIPTESGDSINQKDSSPELRHIPSSDIPFPNKDLPQLEFLLALKSQASVVRWCPRGGSKSMSDSNPSAPKDFSEKIDCLGVLAVATFDGAVNLYAVPNPCQIKDRVCAPSDAYLVCSTHNSSVDLTPCATLMLPNTSCLALDWANHDVIAGGCLNGCVAVWHVFNTLQSFASCSTREAVPLLIRPTHFLPLHSAPIRSISWIRVPPLKRNGQPGIDEDPTFLATTGYDGSVKLVDMDDLAASASLTHERGETFALDFSSAQGSLHLADSDYSIKSICVRPRDLSVTKKVLSQMGLIWQISSSDYHSFIAYAAADGVCGLASMARSQKYRSRATTWALKVYQMDFNRNTSELRMLDNHKPLASLAIHFNDEKPSSDEGLTSMNEPNKNNKTKEKQKPKDQKEKSKVSTGNLKSNDQYSGSPIGTYPPIVGVHCLSWCPSIRRGTVLASGMGCGLVRIDSVEGGLNKKAMRFRNIEKLLNDAIDSENEEQVGDNYDPVDEED
ncbi:WD40-repeat-containing domain protein [Phakopsora pachyrhizi]|uniref:WD40-repeat-containing domain protein n=1 Tax=Phakopsora pachyrhizi TaxID=170000 RepID=A0AAV0B965_PHAPC|nr:WD40-repeat-containing domain protein [Phakopsora pachyrhizi]CAH7683534.1 WD40-repeat-containing domain protein [Phakopsora pachyrhizi]